MHSLWNILLLIIFLILATKLHTLDNDKTKLEADKNLLKKRLELAGRRKSVTENKECQQQKEKFVELQKTCDYKDEQIRRLKLKQDYFRSRWNHTLQVQAEVQDMIQPVECAVENNWDYARIRWNHTLQVQAEVQDKIQPVECAVENNWDYAQIYIYVVEANIFSLVCVLMYVVWNSYKTKTTNSTNSDDLTEEELLQFGEYLHYLHLQPSCISCWSNDISIGQIALRKLWQHLLATPMGKRAMRKRAYRPTNQQSEDRWAKFTASRSNQLQIEIIKSNMTSTANFYQSSHDNAEKNYNENPSNEHGWSLDDYRAHVNEFHSV